MAETTIQKLKDRLNKLLRQKELAAQKAEMLEEQAARDRQREDMMTELVQQLMDRQRELNIMLNRSNLMLSRSHEASMALSLEFTELCRALPAPEDPEVKERIQRINDLFTKTGIEDAELSSADLDQQQAPHPTIVTPPPHPAGTPGEPVQHVEPEIIVEAVTQDVSPDPVIEPEVRPTIAPSLEDLFRRTGLSEEPVGSKPTVQASAPSEPKPVPEQVDSELEAEGDGGRRWWQLLGRR